ncbi:MAG: PAS domain-containing protein [Pseudomonadales bacterium]|nr:PAS domain-containing protein [Pseudomonadales bacterium]
MISNSAKYHHILDNMHTAVMLFNRKLHIQYMNTSAENLMQLSAKRLEGLHVTELLSENGIVPEGLSKAFADNARITKRQTTLHLSTPTEINVDYTVTPLSDVDDLCLMEIQPLDRAIRISQEKMLLSSEKVSRQLIRGLAHEVKNPLGGLRGSAQLLERELNDPSQREYTTIIIREADRLRNLVDQMLGPREALDIEPINIIEIIEHVRKLLLAETQKELNIRFDYDVSIPEIEADREQLIQAILNIARNAMQALLESDTCNPKLTFRTRIQRQFTIDQTFHRLVLKLDIEDNGPGIPYELQERLFFPMVTGRSQGTGLGLSISQTITSQHNGLIKFESEAGKTVFSIFLPLTIQ